MAKGDEGMESEIATPMTALPRRGVDHSDPGTEPPDTSSCPRRDQKRPAWFSAMRVELR